MHHRINRAGRQSQVEILRLERTFMADSACLCPHQERCRVLHVSMRVGQLRLWYRFRCDGASFYSGFVLSMFASGPLQSLARFREGAVWGSRRTSSANPSGIRWGLNQTQVSAGIPSTLSNLTDECCNCCNATVACLTGEAPPPETSWIPGRPLTGDPPPEALPEWQWD